MSLSILISFSLIKKECIIISKKMITKDLSKQQALDSDPKAI